MSVDIHNVGGRQVIREAAQIVLWLQDSRGDLFRRLAV
jgi:hypothetical protein